MTTKLILLAFAFVCFFLATMPMTDPYHGKLISAGLAFGVAALIFG